MLTPHNGRRQFSLSGIQTYNHLHAYTNLYHLCYSCPVSSEWNERTVF